MTCLISWVGGVTAQTCISFFCFNAENHNTQSSHQVQYSLGWFVDVLLFCFCVCAWTYWCVHGVHMYMSEHTWGHEKRTSGSFITGVGGIPQEGATYFVCFCASRFSFYFLKIIYFCVGVMYVCVLCALVCRCSGPCTYVEAREKCCLSCLTTLHLTPHSHWTWGYSGGTQAPTILLSLPQPQHWTSQHNVDTFAFLNMCSRDLNPGPCACMSNTWPSEPSPQSQVLILFFFWKQLLFMFVMFLWFLLAVTLPLSFHLWSID